MEITPIVNRVAKSGIITLNLEEFLPSKPIIGLDLKDFLFKGLILREKEFRAALKELDWSQYKNEVVAVFCSVNAIIPHWAYMLLSIYLEGNAEFYFFGDKKAVSSQYLLNQLRELDSQKYIDKRVVIKGCGDKAVEAVSYMEISRILKPHVKSLMYGEPCSTVPIYKKRNK